MIYPLTISQPRSARWYELAELCSNRHDTSATFSEVWRIEATGRTARRLLEVLRGLDHEATTREVAGRAGIKVSRALTALRVLRGDGEVLVRQGRASSGRMCSLWSAR